MIKNFLILLMVVFSVNGAKYHTDSRGAEIHTPFRWIVADSTARMALSVNAVDTQKFCFQLEDTTIWCLIDNSPKNWAWVSGKKVDSLYMRTFQAVTAGISRLNIDTSKTRHATADSATIPVEKGVKTFRDSSYFAGGLRGSRLYMQTASVDSFTKSFVVRGNVFGFSQTAGSCPFTSYGTTNKINGYFGTLSNNDGGVICYDSSGTARINLPTRGRGYILGSIAINQTTPDSTLTVGGSAHITGNARIDGGLRLGSGDLLSVYDTGSFACSLFDDNTYRAHVTATYTIIGNVVNLSIPSVTGTMSGITTTYLGTIPEVIRPSGNTLISTTVIINNSSLESGRVMYVTGTPTRFRIHKLSTTSLDAGEGGINDGFTGKYKFTYKLN